MRHEKSDPKPQNIQFTVMLDKVKQCNILTFESQNLCQLMLSPETLIQKNVLHTQHLLFVIIIKIVRLQTHTLN